MPVPPELKDSSVIEQRIVLFSKIRIVQNRFSQNWCKGQLRLFTQDVVEVAEQLPLPLCNAELVIIAESCGNLQQQREFRVNTERLRTGRQWLLSHNSIS